MEPRAISLAKKRVVIFSPYGLWAVHNQLEAVVGSALQQQGAEVVVIGCDGLFHSECYILRQNPNKREGCAGCAHAHSNLFSVFQLPRRQLREFLTPQDFADQERLLALQPTEGWEDIHFEGFPLGRIVRPAVCSYLRITPSYFKTPRAQQILRRYAADAFLCVRGMQRVFDTYKPDHLLEFNGNGFLHGAAFYEARQRKIPILCHEKAAVDGTFIFYDSVPISDTRPQAAFIHTWRDVPLQRAELEQVTQSLLGRERGQGMNVPAFYSYASDPRRVRRQLRIGSSQRIVSAFTSSEYELVYWEDLLTMCDQLAMLDQLFEIFKTRSEALVVRHHPNVAGGAHAPPDFSFLTRLWNQAKRAPANVRVIMPNERLTSYALLPLSSACLSSYSTMSVEALARGVPSACHDQYMYASSLPYTFNSIEERKLRSLLDSMLNHQVGPEDLSKLYRMYYALFLRMPATFKSFSVRDKSQADIRINELRELLPGNDPALDRVCQHILAGTSVWPEPTADDLRSSALDEQEYLQARTREIVQQRTEFQREEIESDDSHVMILAAQFPHAASSSADWWRPQRHQAFNVTSWSIGDDWVANLSAALRCLEASTAPFVAFGLPGHWCASSFLSTALDILSDTPAYGGIAFRHWDEKCGQLAGVVSHDELLERSRSMPTALGGLLPLSAAVLKKGLAAELLVRLMSARTSAERSQIIGQVLTPDRLCRSDEIAASVQELECLPRMAV